MKAHKILALSLILVAGLNGHAQTKNNKSEFE